MSVAGGRAAHRVVPRAPDTPRAAALSGSCSNAARRGNFFGAFCVRRAPDDGQAAHDWPGQRQPIRPLAASLPSSCRISSRWRAAGTLSYNAEHEWLAPTGCIGHRAPMRACSQAAAARPTPMAQLGVTAAIRTSARAGVPPVAAGAGDERNERRKEDRSGGRAWEACKRARQESVHLLSSPSGFRPMPTVGLATRPKRRPPGGPVSRGAKLARRAE